MNDFSNANNNKKTFKVLRNTTTHTEWMINKKCEAANEVFRSYDGYLNASHCSIKLLINFFHKLQTLQIYDKTKIIVVSDHGSDDYYFSSASQAKSFNALMLIKDFNSIEKFKTSNQFLSNVDTYAIALSGVSNNKEIRLDPIKNPKQDRSLIYVSKLHKWKHFTITEAFRVKKNIFDKNNWEKLNKKQIQELGKEEYR